MYRRKLLLMLSALMVGIIAIAAPRTAEQAKKIAAEQASKLGITSASPKMMKTAPRRSATIGQDSFTDAENSYYYIFNNEGGKGFTIVSGDDLMNEIVGYSDSGSLSEENMPANLKSFLRAYEQTLDRMAEGDAKTLQIVNELKARRAESNGVYTVGDILLGNVKWDQMEPYNRLCPTYKGAYGSDQHSATGCCATAVAQIMMYHKWPKELTVDIPDYTTNYYGTTYNWEGVKVEAEGHPYDWENMLESYSESYTEEQAIAVSRLMSDVGRAVKMEYGPESVSMNIAPFSALTEYFDYDPDFIQMIFRQNVSLAKWTEILKKDINERRPVYYYGSSNGGGHMFVCDGYDNNDFFHINWGWSGMCNGFFDITVLNPYNNEGTGASRTEDGYDMLNTIIVGIRPNNGVEDKPQWEFQMLYAEQIQEHTIIQSTRQNKTENFSLSVGLKIQNYDNKTFIGEIGLANIDKEGNMSIIASSKVTINPYYYYGPFNISYAFPVGKNTIVGVEKPEGSSEWELANLAQSNAINLIATETELSFAEPELLSLNLLNPEITAGSGEVEVEITNNTYYDYYGRVRIYVTDTKEEFEANADKLTPVNAIPLGLDCGKSIKKSVTVTTNDINKVFWLTFCDDNGNVIGSGAITTVANAEPTFVITGYSIDGQEITPENDVKNMSLWNGNHDVALAHNTGAPKIAIHVKNLGIDGIFYTTISPECQENGYPTFGGKENIKLEIPSGETRDIESKSPYEGESLCLWTIIQGSTPFIVGNVPFGQVYNGGLYLLIYAYNDATPASISVPFIDIETTGEIYNIRGQRVKNPTEKGIYIIGKKKVLVK